MPVSRRSFVSGVSSAASLAFCGLAGEVRAHAAEAVGVTDPVARILFNENPLGPSPKALRALSGKGMQFARYPLGEGAKLAMKLRKLNGLPYAEPRPGLSLRPPETPDGPMDLVVGVGSSEILNAAAWAYCSQSVGNVVEAYPGYSAVGSAASRIPGAQIERKLVPLDSNHCLDAKAMIDAIDNNTRIVVICNPNNPTGTTIPLSDIEAIANAAPKDALVFVDEAYIEFTEDGAGSSALDFAKTKQNVLIARTFSKIYGLAGLRVGYGISSKAVIENLKQYMLGGLAHNMPGILAALAAVDDVDHIAATQTLKEKTHETWGRAFKKFGWKMPSTVTSFCWVDVGYDCSELVAFLAKRNVLISGGQRWVLPNYVRISMGTEEENDRLVAGARAFIAS
ncbi:MAG: pyridoxal phosphate-dependent aminotransferase [Aureliella sp.]